MAHQFDGVLKDIIRSNVDPLLKTMGFRRKNYQWRYHEGTLQLTVVLERVLRRPDEIWFTLCLESRNLGHLKVNDVTLGTTVFECNRIGNMLDPPRTIWWKLSNDGLEYGSRIEGNARQDEGELLWVIKRGLISKISEVQSNWVADSATDFAIEGGGCDDVSDPLPRVEKYGRGSYRLYMDDMLLGRYPQFVDRLISEINLTEKSLSASRYDREQISIESRELGLAGVRSIVQSMSKKLLIQLENEDSE